MIALSGIGPTVANAGITFHVRADASGSQPSPWAWSIHRAGQTAPFMRSTLTFASRALAVAAGKKALAGFQHAERKAGVRAREP